MFTESNGNQFTTAILIKLSFHMCTDFANMVGLHQLEITYLGFEKGKDVCFNIMGSQIL